MRQRTGEPSAGQWLLIHRIAALTVQLETLDARVASGEAVDCETYTKLTNTLNRVLTTVGLQRRARDVTPAGRVVDSFAAAVRAADSEEGER